jgi:hypothetical protein
MRNIPPHIFKQIQEAICRPEGTFSFEYNSKDLFDRNKKGGIVLEIPSGGHLFRIERDGNLLLHFYHSSPGTGTRVATIDLKELPPAEKIFMTFTWTPAEVKFYVGPRVPNSELYSATGTTSKKQFRVGKDGSVFQVGDHSVEVMGISVFQGGVSVLQPTAIEAWKETLKATEILSTGESAQGYIYEVVVTNLTLAILVSGFEAYSKKRLVELELEGVNPNTSNLINSFFPKKEREAGIAKLLEEEAKEQSKTVLQVIDERNIINFQSFQKCKLAYNKAYGIKFGELDLPAATIAKLQKFIKFRHRIIHVSPSMGMLNQPEVPPEEPVFPKKELALEARQIFDQFIEQLHNSTMKLRPTD